jgi:hypothetical protein
MMLRLGKRNIGRTTGKFRGADIEMVETSDKPTKRNCQIVQDTARHAGELDVQPKQALGSFKESEVGKV